jgi:hypothetical protein
MRPIAIVLDPSDAALDDLLQRVGRGSLMRRPECGLAGFSRCSGTRCSCSRAAAGFDDPSGLETTQILRYAARAIEPP